MILFCPEFCLCKKACHIVVYHNISYPFADKVARRLQSMINHQSIINLWPHRDDRACCFSQRPQGTFMPCKHTYSGLCSVLITTEPCTQMIVMEHQRLSGCEVQHGMLCCSLDTCGFKYHIVGSSLSCNVDPVLQKHDIKHP